MNKVAEYFERVLLFDLLLLEQFGDLSYADSNVFHLLILAQDLLLELDDLLEGVLEAPVALLDLPLEVLTEPEQLLPLIEQLLILPL